jgi:hypothetical protein
MTKERPRALYPLKDLAMPRLTRRLLLASLVLALPAALFAADPPAGRYKIVLGGGRTFWLIKLEAADGKWTGDITPAPKGPAATVQGVKVDKGTLQFTLDSKDEGTFVFEGRVPKDKDGKIFGTLSAQDNIIPVTLEPTTLVSLDPFDISRELLTKSTDHLEVTQAAMVCLSHAAAKKAKAEEVKGWAEKALQAAEPFGPKWKRSVIMQLAGILGEQDGFTGLALDYAEQAAKGLERDSDSPSLQKHILDLYADALDKAGRTEDAKKVRDDIGKIALVIAKPFSGRKGKSDRVVLVELFTCAEERASAAPDVAFAALLQTFKPTDVVLVQYHLNQPGGDPLANAEAEARAKAYFQTPRTPSLVVNGNPVDSKAGGPAESQAAYEHYKDLIAVWLEKPAKMKIDAQAKRTGATIDIKVDVGDLPETGLDIRLRVVLVEDQVAYVGSNKTSRYVQVVRHFPGGVAGKSMKAKSATEKYTVDVDKVRETLKAYLDKNKDKYPTKERPLDLKKLRVVAFVQNDETGEVLNAVQVDVKGE